MADVVRDSSWIRREYGEEKWPAIISQLEATDANAEQLIHTIAMGSSEARPVSLASSVVDLPERLALSGYLGWVAGCVAEYAQRSEIVIELGAGWGRNLLLSWLSGANPNARYIAAEFTEAGRRASELLAERAACFDLSVVDFDYRNPTLEGVDYGSSATVFSVHSIEQIPHLDRKVLDVIRSVAKEVVTLHFEPVGWQVRGDSSSAYAEEHDYNRNLYPLLASEGVNVVELEVDVIGINPRNPTTKIVWK